MKKIFTLIAGLFMTAAVFAADHRPVVTVSSAKNYKIVIDGRSYFGSNMTLTLDNLYGNRAHSIQVYEMKRGFFSRERMVDAKSFQVGRNDLMITIDRFGNINLKEKFDGFPRRDQGRDNRDSRDDHGNGRDRNDRGRF